MSEIDDPFAAVRARYLTRLSEEAAVLDQLIKCDPPEAMAQIGEIAHRVAGSSGTFGLADLSASARAVERAAARTESKAMTAAQVAAPLVAALALFNRE